MIVFKEEYLTISYLHKDNIFVCEYSGVLITEDLANTINEKRIELIDKYRCRRFILIINGAKTTKGAKKVLLSSKGFEGVKRFAILFKWGLKSFICNLIIPTIKKEGIPLMKSFTDIDKAKLWLRS